MRGVLGPRPCASSAFGAPGPPASALVALGASVSGVEALLGTRWLFRCAVVVVAALTADPRRVWVETTEALPKDRRYFVASVAALEPVR